MKIRSPNGLHYPITVVELAKRPDDDVQRFDSLFTYYYETTVTEGDKYGDEKQVKKKFPARFDSSLDGKLTDWFIKNGSVIKGPGVDLVEIEEPCTHETQFGGLCVNCGKDMTEVNYITDERDISRATVNMTHDNVALLVSQKEARQAEEDSKRRLLGQKKLSLIVDLDQTVIHTTCERTIAEWQEDKNNPNYEAVKDVKKFQLADDKFSNVAGNWYYCKLRPGLQEFFEKISTMYELHIYTMATRAYAEEVANIIDPDRRFFGGRILSRDENGTDQIKSLHRLFPTNTDMVVIIDDRGDIWHWSDNLLRVRQYNFFLGAGDINASFLPKQQELITASAQAQVSENEKPNEKEGKDGGEEGEAVSVAGKPTETVPVSAENGTLTDLEQQLIAMGAGDKPEVLEQQVKEQEKVIISQQTERPLLQKQRLLDEKEEAAEVEEAAETKENGEAITQEHHKSRQSLLHDDDHELKVIETCLRRVHQAFYDEYQKKRSGHQGGRVAELRGQKSPKKRALDDLGVVPDVKAIMPRMKRRVLEGTSIVFSGIIPLGMDVQSSDIALWARSFGAQVTTDITRQTTHVIANPTRKTTKVKRAARFGRIKIVVTDWLLECFSKWERVDVAPYLIEVDPAEQGPHVSGDGSFEELEDVPLSAEDEDTGVTGDEDNVEDDENAPSEEFQMTMSDEKWQSMGDEFEDFMGESGDSGDDSGSDSESVQSDASVQTTESAQRGRRKRKRTIGSTDNSEAEDSDASVKSTTGPGLQRKKKRALGRVSSLTNVVSADKSSGLPSPETTGPEEEQGDDAKGEVDVADNDDDDGDLEAALMAEFDKDEGEDDA